MKELLSGSTIKSVLLLSVFSCVGPVFSADDWPFPAGDAKVCASEDGDTVSLSNGLTGITVYKKDARIKGIWSSKDGKIAGEEKEKTAPRIWNAEILKKGESKATDIGPVAIEKSECSVQGDDTLKKIVLRYPGIRSGDSIVDVECAFSLKAGDPMIHWNGGIKISGDSAKLWSFTYPSILIFAVDKSDSKDNETVYPYRRGRKGYFGNGNPRYDAFQPYPGPAAKFQFMAAYGKNSQKGFYFAAEDGSGYLKTFRQKNRPEFNGIIFEVQHFPTGMGFTASDYKMAYDVVSGPFRGNWWHAARIYRDWWTKQVWASKGLMCDRKDVPGWLKTSPISVRLSTTKKGRTVANNLELAERLVELVGHKPFFGVWYGPFDRGIESDKGLGDTGHGHILPLKNGAAEAIRKLKSENVYLQAYIQSIIYSAKDDLFPEERPKADAAVTRDINGNMCFYGSGEDKSEYAMCRASEWWQQRLVDLSADAVKKGFTGVYLDSFGKGASDCFADNHKHPRGGGNTLIAGQRVAAEKIRKAIRAINPEAIMSGEDPGEAFRDLLDVNLSSMNVYQEYLPVFRAVWGDYELLYGRTITATENGQNLVPEMARLFIEGMIIGRFFCESGNFFMDKPEFDYGKKLLTKYINYSETGIDYLRFGEFLNPAVINSPLPEVSFVGSGEKGKISTPAVVNSVMKSHRDGSVAYVFANTVAEAQTVDFTVDPALLGNVKSAGLFMMDEKGNRKSVRKINGASSEKAEIPGYGVLFFIMKKAD